MEVTFNDNRISKFTKSTKNQCINEKERCFTDTTLEIWKKRFNIEDEYELIKTVKSVSHCSTDLCAVENDSDDKVRENVFLFKPKKDSLGSGEINSYDIINVLGYFALVYNNFFNALYILSDVFDYNNIMRNIDLNNVLAGKEKCFVRNLQSYKMEKCNTLGCIINTDIHTGPGIHWMALFVDMRNNRNTVEFFNSSGNPPRKTIYELMNKLARQINGNVVIATKRRHQEEDLECGVYSLFFIKSRLDGTDIKKFDGENEIRIRDDEMEEFRKYIFIDETYGMEIINGNSEDGIQKSCTEGCKDTDMKSDDQYFDYKNNTFFMKNFKGSENEDDTLLKIGNYKYSHGWTDYNISNIDIENMSVSKIINLINKDGWIINDELYKKIPTIKPITENKISNIDYIKLKKINMKNIKDIYNFLEKKYKLKLSKNIPITHNSELIVTNDDKINYIKNLEKIQYLLAIYILSNINI